MKRIILFLATNIAVLLVLSIVVSVLGLDRWLMADGIDYTTLLVFSAVMGFGGSLLSLLMSKTVAKWSTGAQVIDGSEGTTQDWLVQTVKKLADKAGVGMPEVAVYEGPANAFATGAFKDSALVAVSSGLLESMSREEVEAVLGHELSHVANGDMVTLTLIQGVLNTFVVFLSRVVGYLVDKAVFRTERGIGPGFYITVIVCQILFGILASMVGLVFALPRVPRRRGLGAAARLAAADDRGAVAPGRDSDQRAARVGEGLRHRQPLGLVQPLRHASPDRGAHRRAPGAQQLKALLAWYFVAVWGAGYVATKLGLQYAPPFTFLSLRFAFGLLCLLPLILLAPPAWPRTPKELWHLVVAGLLMHAVQLGGSHYAQYLGMSAGVAALIISCQPLLTAGVASRFLNERLAPGQWAGVFIGLAGVALVVWHKIDIHEVTLGSLAGTLVALAGVTP